MNERPILYISNKDEIAEAKLLIGVTEDGEYLIYNGVLYKRFVEQLKENINES